LPNVQLKVEPGTKLKLTLRTLELFYNIAQTFNRRHWKIDRMCKRQEERKEEIINIAKTNNGLRGIISEKDNFDLTVSRSVHNVFDQNKLQKRLDVLNSMGLIRNISMSFSFCPTAMPEEHLLEKIQEIERIIKKDLIKMGVFYELVPMEINIKVDEKSLNKEIDNKKIKLLPGTKKSEIIWKVLPKKHH